MISVIAAGLIFLAPTITNAETKVLSFGSCNHQLDSQDYWPVIASFEPDLWLWLGDTIYADGLSPGLRSKEYRFLRQNHYYQAFAKGRQVSGIYDDHDFWANAAGGRSPHKQASKEAFLDFLEEPHTSPRRQRPGAYGYLSMKVGNKRIGIYLLDTRYFKDLEPSAPLLGSEQWNWLAGRFLDHRTTDDAVILVSSIAVISDSTFLWIEGWERYPEEKQRLYELIKAAQKPTLILSGDRHFAEFSRYPKEPGEGALCEFMSSGLTHSRWLPVSDHYRIGRKISRRNFGVIRVSDDTGELSVQFEARSPRNGKLLGKVQAILDGEVTCEPVTP